MLEPTARSYVRATLRKRELRDLIVAVEAHSGKAYRLGSGKIVTRSNLAKANQNRECRIFEEYAYYMMELARNLNDTTIFNLGELSMPSIPQPSNSALQSSAGRSSARRKTG